MDLPQLKRLQRQSVGFLLIRAGHLWNERAIQLVNARAGRPVFREVHTRLLPLLQRREGARLTELARRLGVKKQSVQPLLTELKALGVVETRPDPDDRRAVRAGLTAFGRKAIADGNVVLRDIERQLAQTYGPSRMRQLRRLLDRLLALLELETPGGEPDEPTQPPRPSGRRR